MNEVDKCPKCGSTELGKGKFSGYAVLTPLHKLFSMGSDVIADVCTECGYVISLKVKNPEKFK